MAKRTLNQIAKIIADRVDVSRDDTTFIQYIEDQLRLTLQEIIGIVPYARWLTNTGTITTVANQQYISPPSDLDIDNVITMRDETNNRQLIRIDPQEADYIDPERDLSGDPEMWWYLNGKFYFLPRPDTALTLNLDYGKLITDPLTTETCVLPAKYESIWIDLALPKVYERLDPDHDTTVLLARGQGGISALGEPTGLARIIWDARQAMGQSDILASHRPVTTSGITGARFPSDYDIS